MHMQTFEIIIILYTIYTDIYRPANQNDVIRTNSGTPLDLYQDDGSTYNLGFSGWNTSTTSGINNNMWLGGIAMDSTETTTTNTTSIQHDQNNSTNFWFSAENRNLSNNAFRSHDNLSLDSAPTSMMHQDDNDHDLIAPPPGFLNSSTAPPPGFGSNNGGGYATNTMSGFVDMLLLDDL